MRVPHNAVVMVADGRKLLFLRNEGDAVALNLQVEHAEEKPNPSDSDQKTDFAGRAQSARVNGGAFAPGSSIGLWSWASKGATKGPITAVATTSRTRQRPSMPVRLFAKRCQPCRQMPLAGLADGFGAGTWLAIVWSVTALTPG